MMRIVEFILYLILPCYYLTVYFKTLLKRKKNNKEKLLTAFELYPYSLNIKTCWNFEA